MLTPDTIRAEVKRRIVEDHLEAERQFGNPRGMFQRERVEALEELEQWIAGEMAKQAREYARQHYQAELAKHQKAEA